MAKGVVLRATSAGVDAVMIDLEGAVEEKDRRPSSVDEQPKNLGEGAARRIDCRDVDASACRTAGRPINFVMAGKLIVR